ncbi:hypothetical protein H0H81_009033 [Sphagnurus paluster]|uniref:Cytochrome P450 n=1 Tax=Sphagnurus paluster TaxID=117069 RepID=A0A9P7FSB9_9AGAR|nr:hypothetical protein H0H81_009033 [Sphagnurus paluster]
MITQTVLLASIPVLVAVLVATGLRNKRRRASLPPGPRGWPIIGNLFDMPQNMPWLTFADWGKKYGEISSVTVFGQPIIVINSVDVALAILNGKSDKYSDRPVLPMGGELIGWKNALPLVRYGDEFNQYRRFFHSRFGTKKAVEPFHDFEAVSIRNFLQKILDAPEELIPHLKSYVLLACEFNSRAH